MGPGEISETVEFPLLSDTLAEPSAFESKNAPQDASHHAIAPPVDDVPARPGAEPEQSPAPGAVMAPVDAERPRNRSLADAVEGIALPCDLAPLMGVGPLTPREVAFFTTGFSPATVGSELSDEFERLGYEITPIDDRSIRAERGVDTIEARLLGHEFTPPEVMHELHPSAPAGALVVEMKLT